MTSTDLIIFFGGSFTGSLVTFFICAVYCARKFDEAHDELVSTRETIRRHAYSKGYEDAKMGGLKRA